MRSKFDNYLNTPRTRKVKHVKFLYCDVLEELETMINGFADDHPEYKILGIKLTMDESKFIGVVTYLENAKGVEYGEYYDDSYEETDSD